jgi:hypothetical protein
MIAKKTLDEDQFLRGARFSSSGMVNETPRDSLLPVIVSDSFASPDSGNGKIQGLALSSSQH